MVPSEDLDRVVEAATTTTVGEREALQQEMHHAHSLPGLVV
jgi:hypothetical protein